MIKGMNLSKPTQKASTFNCKTIDLNLCQLVIENDSIKRSNARLWTVFLDRKLHEYMIIYNFNYYEISNKFHDIIILPIRYEFTEEEIRKHWSFLYCCRMVGFVPEETYYANLKGKYKEMGDEKEKNEIDKRSGVFNEKLGIGSEDVFVQSDEVERIDNSESMIKNKEVAIESEEDCSGVVQNKEGIGMITSKVTEAMKSSKSEEREEDNPAKSPIQISKKVKYEISEEDEKEFERKIMRKKEREDYPIRLNDIEPSIEINKINIPNDKFDFSIDNSVGFDEFIKENQALNDEYQKINKYFEFAMKGISHLLPSSVNSQERNEEIQSENEIMSKSHTSQGKNMERQIILEASKKINDLIDSSIRQIDSEKKEEKEENENQTDDNNKDNEDDDDKDNDNLYDEGLIKENEKKMEAFRKYLFSSGNRENGGNNINLLENIINIISNSNNDEIRIRNESDFNETFEDSSIKVLSSINNIADSNNNSVLCIDNDIRVQKEKGNSGFYRGIRIKEKNDEIEKQNKEGYEEYDDEDSYKDDN